MLLNLPVEVRFIIYRNLVPQDVGHSVVSSTENPSLISKSQRKVLATCRTIRDEFLPLVYEKCSVELHACPWHNAWPIQRNRLAFTYQASGEAPWITRFLQDLGTDIKFLAQIKIVQKLHGSHTVLHSKVWTRPLKAICENLRGCCDIQFETEEAGLLSADIDINIAYWHGQAAQHYLQAKVPNQKGPELVFEYQLEHKYGEPWKLSEVEKLCTVHRAVWKVPGQHFTLH